MRVLALDTTTRLASVAMAEDDHVLAEELGDVTRSHAEQLPAAITRLLDHAGASISTVDVFAIASGPGSFTGLRIGIATIQGLAVVAGRRVVPVSALDALAHSVAATLQPGTLVGAWMDAHRQDVFSALYRVADRPPYARDRLVEIDAASVGDPRATLERWAREHATPAVIVGDGAAAFARHIQAAGIRGMVPAPLAATIALIARARAAEGQTVGPAGVQPLYVRRPDAEIAREEARGSPER